MKQDIKSKDYRMGMYLLLARLFGKEVDREFMENLLSVGLLKELEQANYHPGIPNGEISDNLLETLANEYTRLFVGPGPHVSLYGSVYSIKEGDDARLWGKSTTGVKKFIEASGLKFAENYGGIPDRLSIELEFMAHLIRAEEEAREKKDLATVDTLRSVQKRFMKEYLMSWFPNFVTEVEKFKPHPFYGCLTSFCLEWLNSELNLLS